jgi:hypothetical protein
MGNCEVLKEIAVSQDHNHLSHATWECTYRVVFTPKYRKALSCGQIPQHLRSVFCDLCPARGMPDRGRAPDAQPNSGRAATSFRPWGEMKRREMADKQLD